MSNKLQLDLSGGQNSENTPLVLKDNESELIVNYELTRVGGLRKRPGYFLQGSQMSAGNVVKSIQFEAKTDGGQQTYAQVGTGVYNIGETSSFFSTGTTGRLQFENFAGRTFVAGLGDLKSSADIDSGVDYTSCPADAVDFRPQYIKSFEKRLYGAKGLASGDSHSRIYWSDLWDGDSALTWEVSGTDLVNFEEIGEGQNQGSPITGLDVNGNRLIIGKMEGLWRWQFGVENRQINNVGPLEQELMITNYELGITFFVSRLGVHSYAPLSEGRPRIISRPIQRWFDRISVDDWRDNGVMTVDNDHVYIFNTTDVTLDDVTVVNPCFVYNISSDAWTIWSFPQINVKSVSFEKKNDTKGKMYLGDDDGNAYKLKTFNSNEATYKGDNGSAIPTDWISKEYLISFPEQSRTNKIDVFSSCEGRTQVFFDIDREGEFRPIGELAGRITTLKTDNPRYHTIRLRATGNFEGEALLEGFNIRSELLKYDHHEKRHGK